MDSFQEALQVMEFLFQKDYQFALATSENNIPSVRFVDTYYQDQAFYLVTSKASQKVQEIIKNPKVALTNRLYRFQGEAEVLGHPLDPALKDIRDTLTKVFKDWYFAHNKEEDADMCYVKISLVEGFFYHDQIGYKVDFQSKTVKKNPFDFDIVPMS